MRVNNIYKKDDIISLVTHNTSDVITIFKYIYGNIKTVVIPKSITTIGDYKYITINALNTDCYLLVNIDNNIEIIRVGEPPVITFLFNLTGNLNYKLLDYNSNILKESRFESIGDNFYVIPLNRIDKCFYNIEGNIITPTLPKRYDYFNISEGSIMLERGVWQLIAIPEVGSIKDIFIDRLEAQEKVSATTLIEVCSAYPGHLNKFLSYIPGFTLYNSEHNFKLRYDDQGKSEITAFWVKCKYWTHTTKDIEFKWKIKI